MQTDKKPSCFTLLMMISFASVNAVLFTPALPDITHFFSISSESAQYTIIWFLVGYTLGQLLYGPIANRYGRKTALYFGISLQIISSLICILAGMVHHYSVLVTGRFLLALGAGVGLKITFTLINECYEPKIASQKISYLMLAFATIPALSVALGGILNAHYGWMSCFYAGAVYGLLLLFLVTRLPETQTTLDLHALKIKNLLHGYTKPFKNPHLIAGGFLMGASSAFIYIFAAIAPFIAMNLLGMNSIEYGIANILPTIGLIVGLLISAQLTKKISLQKIIRLGIWITFSGVVLMFIFALSKTSAIYYLFFPMIVIYFGLSLIIANASVIAMSEITDKAHGSAVMNFINMGVATISVLALGLFQVSTILLPIVYLMICVAMMGSYKVTVSKNQ